MRPQSPSLTIGGTVLKESDELVLLGVTFDSKMTFEQYLRSVSRPASQRLGILRKFWRVFHDRSLLWRCFLGFDLHISEYCSAVWYSAADTNLNPLDRSVSGARFLTECVFECDIAHHRSVAALCMQYKIRCKPMHILIGALPAWSVCASAGYRRCPGHTSVNLRAAFAAEPRSIVGLLSPLRVLLKRSC